MKWKSNVVLCAIGLLSLGTLSVAAAARNWVVPGAGPTKVSVVLSTERSLSEEVSQGIDAELRRLFGTSDVLVEIEIPNRGAHTVWDTEVILTTVTGKCEIGAMPPLHPHRPDTLGRTMVTDGVVLPFIEINCAQISGAIRSHVIGKQPGERERLLGRAIARVLAHEIFHVLTRSHHHSAEGVAAESIRPAALVAERLDFRFEDFEQMGLLAVLPTH